MSSKAYQPHELGLRNRCRGTVIGPRDEGYDEARRVFNLTTDQYPALIAFPQDAADVAVAVRYAAARGLRVAPRRTGHNAGPLPDLGDTLVLRTDGLQGVEIDASARRARAAAGSRWWDVVPQASAHGLAALHGSTPDVSIPGYTLGGGMGWYARKHGLACNSVRAIEIVTADGALRRVDAEHEPDLFWALRGGGGNFGVVTALEFDLFRASRVYAGCLFFPFEQAAELLHTWRELTYFAPEELTSAARLLQFPPLPDIPEPFRGQAFAMVEAVFLGSEAAGVEILRPLRALKPVMDTFAVVPPVHLVEHHMDPRAPIPYVSDSRLLGDLPAETFDDLLAVAGPGSGSGLVSLELRHAGGALARADWSHGALATVPGTYHLMSVGIAATPEMALENRARLDQVVGAVAAHETGRAPNFTTKPVAVERFYDPFAYRRLQAVKAEYDPTGLFLQNHPNTPT
jgi:FAD/FMN-containing dehydrogenase